MPYCPYCGSAVQESHRFCMRCGAGVNILTVPPRYYPGKQSENLVNGLLIGGSAVAFVIFLLLSLSLNDIYWTQYRVLTFRGLQPNDIYLLSSDLVGLMSFLGLVVVFSIYVLINSTLRQFSSTFRNLSLHPTGEMSLGNSLIVGGVIFTGSTLQDTVGQLYRPESYQSSLLIISQILGPLLLVIGFMFSFNSYLKARKLTAKV